MKVKIKISEGMDYAKSPLGSIEDRLIRIPSEMRRTTGLEIGTFLILKAKDGGSVALQIAPSFKQDALNHLASVFVSKVTHDLLDLEKTMAIKPASDILVGCDPEFFLVDGDTGFHISASNFFPHYGEIGSDVGLAELRPRPALNAAAMVAELRKLIHQVTERLNTRIWMKARNIKMVAASYLNNASAGFHVHFGLPPKLLRPSAPGFTLIQAMVKVMDYYIGLPSILPEGNDDPLRRTKQFSNYGKPGDYRSDLKTLEYRVPGGHLLRHPILVAGLISLSLLVMRDLLSRFSTYSAEFTVGVDDLCKFETLRKLYPNLPEAEQVYSLITTEKIEKTIPHIKTVFSDMINMTDFKRNAPEIVPYFRYISDLLSGKPKFNGDMATNWG